MVLKCWKSDVNMAIRIEAWSSEGKTHCLCPAFVSSFISSFPVAVGKKDVVHLGFLWRTAWDKGQPGVNSWGRLLPCSSQWPRTILLPLPSNRCLPGANTVLLHLDFVLSTVFYFFLTNCPFTISCSVFFSISKYLLNCEFILYLAADGNPRISLLRFLRLCSVQSLQSYCFVTLFSPMGFFFYISIFLILVEILCLKDQLLCWHQHFNCYNGSWIAKWGFALSEVPGICSDPWAV